MMDSPADTNVAGEELRSFVERIERLEEEKKTISDDIKDVYGEAKGRGYDVKVLRRSFRCANRTPTSGRSRKPSWTCISRRWA